MRKILIAGVTSGSGKTTVTLGLLAALREHYQIQAYKVGPDYVDTKFHTRITGRPSRNLDNFLVPDPKMLNYLFLKDTQGIDLAVIEGVMGLYDGLGTDKDAYSTASVAKQLNIPVILVIDARAISTSAAAIVQGFQEFDREVNIVGVIVNHVMSANHYELVRQAIHKYTHLPVVGYLPFKKEVALPSRQLGLVPDQELPTIDQKIEQLKQLVQTHIDLNQLIKLSAPITSRPPAPLVLPVTHLRLGIAQDQAFNFYYADNLDLLQQMGATLVPFSPLTDSHLPAVDALYLGGGYPEEFAAQLAANTTLKQEILAFSQAGKPIYAECGGLMYLGQFLDDGQHSYPMVGVFAGVSHMTPRLKKFGYCFAKTQCDTLLAPADQVIVGHEFHHSTFQTQLPTVFEMTKVRDQQVVATWKGGYQVRHTFASYLHVHFYQNVQFATNFVHRLEGFGT